MTIPAGPRFPPFGESIGRWRLLKCAGHGTFGIVFRVQRIDAPGTVAALKIARESRDPRFEREAKLLDTARSPHLPRLLDKGEWLLSSGQSYSYLVMEWVEGLPLYVMQRETGLTNASAARALAHVAYALAELHRLGGVHRDVKGDNVLVNADGTAVLVDLGAAWHVGAHPLTDTVIPPGTEAYRSPELLRFRRQFRHDPEARYPSCPADDLYALGVMAYRLVTGTYPGPRTDPDISSAEPPRFLPPGALATVRPELERLILRMLSREREARGTAGELADALSRVSTGLEAATPIGVSPSVMETQKTARPGPRFWQVSRTARRLVVLGGCAAVALLMVLPTRGGQHEAPLYVAAAPEQLMDDDRDGGTVGLGEELLASVTRDVPFSGAPTAALALPMPKVPFKGQKKPPCNPLSEREIIGACWVVMELKPPCAKAGFEHDGKCVIPTAELPRPPTSDKP
ncbi:serine/threonine protein kinase [Hyalangium rubrum]|uniref:Serine/threonine-protein kinase n=1 Tax=Hyalangium rubrum TaxID=3103134 RepID=A0ABU5HJ96_9BACT|nr:serine/threonine-protein kinase [Hyalangium sp. s54d21]MDY7232964.1 serine/threonine-protein kinase [Hyalangium sp. s54d21]